MRITMISNYLSLHQLPFTDEMYKRLKNKFLFIATQKMEKERLDMGWKEYNDIPYLLKSYTSVENHKTCQKYADESDVVILGSAPDQWIVERLKQGKLTFKYSERFYKKGLNIKIFS